MWQKQRERDLIEKLLTIFQNSLSKVSQLNMSSCDKNIETNWETFDKDKDCFKILIESGTKKGVLD